MQLYGDAIVNLPLVRAAPEECMGSKFNAYAVRARTLRTVDMAYMKIRAMHPYARHIMMAFDAAGEKGSCDDGETFGGLTLLKELENARLANVAFFIARQPGVQQMGDQRFETICLLCQELIMKLQNQVGTGSWDDQDHDHDQTKVLSMATGAQEDAGWSQDEMDTQRSANAWGTDDTAPKERW